MKIISLEIENVKKIKAATIVPSGAVTQITGRNGSGKSSTLDSIVWALAGMKPITSAPIRDGQESARITLDLGDIVVTRRFTGGRTSDVSVVAAIGGKWSNPQQVLDGLFGKLSFDPLSFTRLDAPKQLEVLKRIVPLDTDVDALDQSNFRDMELRKGWNSKKDSLTEQVKTLSLEIDPTMDVCVIDDAALLSELTNASETNAAINEDRARRQRLSQAIDSERDDARLAREKAAKLITLAEGLEARALESERALARLAPIATPIDVSALRQQIDDARRTNQLCEIQMRAREKHQAVADALQVAVATSQNLTTTMEARKAEKYAAIARAAMPVEGLSFGENEVLFNGLPFSQASSAEQIRVSFALAMAANPQLRVVLIKDGSLLDDKSLAAVAALAEANDYQVFIEKVSTDGRVGILLEEGVVVSIDGVAVNDEPPQPMLFTAGV